jgi:hypothetical protein
MNTYTYAEHVENYPDLTIAQRQRLGVEQGGRPLNDDGIVGPKTRGGIFIPPRSEHRLVDAYLLLAMLNAREEGRNNRGRWPAYLMGQQELLGMTPQGIADMSVAAGARWAQVTQGSWCAGCASTAIRLAYGAGQPWSKGAKQLGRRWAAKPGEEVDPADAQEGDLIIWHREVKGKPWAGHVGVCAGRAPGLLLVLEGNGSRKGGAVGLYGYDTRDGAKRGTGAVVMIARRADT